VISNRPTIKIHRDLVWALESARTKLAVTIAAETKWTPPDRWHYYLETVDRIRRLLKKLRKVNPDLLNERHDWIRALESLEQLPAQGEALELCRILRPIVMELGAALE
jgi:hypothetical protein